MAHRDKRLIWHLVGRESAAAHEGGVRWECGGQEGMEIYRVLTRQLGNFQITAKESNELHMYLVPDKLVRGRRRYLLLRLAPR